jgi:hypothetical protein
VTRRTIAAVAIVAIVLGVGCRRGDEAPAHADPRRCDPGLAVPDGFEVSGGLEDRAPDHVGVRIDLSAPDGRELHFFSGIPGDFGEGLADRGEVELADGSTGRLSGGGTTWVLEWPGERPCSPSVVLGTGMTTRAFQNLLRGAGALPEH